MNKNLLDFISNSPDTFYQTNTEGRLIFISASVKKLLGYTVEELVGTQLADLYLDKTQRQQFIKQLEGADCKLSNYKAPLRHKDGSAVWVSTSATYYYDKAGAVAGVEGITRNVTTEHQAQHEQLKFMKKLEAVVAEQATVLQVESTRRLKVEKSLAEQMSLLDSILQNAQNIAIATTDIDYRITYYNPMAEKLFGYSADEVIGKTVQEVHTLENVSAARFDEALRQVRQNGEYCYQLEQTTAGGNKYIDSRVAGIFSQTGQLIGFSLFSQDVTKEKIAEEKQQYLQTTIIQTKNEWQQIFDSVPEWIVLLDKEYRIVRANLAMAQCFGLKPEQCIGRHCYEIIRNTSQSPESCPYVQTLKDGQIHNNDLYVEQLNSWFNIQIAPMHDVTGKISGAVMVARDISLRKVAEEKLQELNENLATQVAEQTKDLLLREQELQAIFRAAPTGIGMVNNRVLTYINPVVEKMTGYLATELIGQPFQLLYPDDAECDYIGQEKYQQIQAQGTETKWRCKDGRIIDVLLSSTPLDPENLAAGITFTALDISARKKTEQHLARAYSELEQIFNIATPLCQVDKNGIITRVNNAFCLYFGVTGNEIIGGPCHQFWDCSLFGCDQCPIEKIEKGQDSYQREIDLTIDGKRIVCSAHSVPYNDEQGNFLGIITTYFDRSSFLKSQEQLEQTRRQLMHAEKLSAVGRFSASIAHEFNNPLCGVVNVITGISNRTQLSENDQNLANMALQECERMKNLVTDLQQFNKPSTDIRVMMDIEQTIDEILLFTKKELKKKNAQVTKTIPDDLPEIWAVPDQIKQVVINLIGNASDALDSEDGTISITATSDNNNITISIADNGEGIAPTELVHIFEPFYTTKAIKGTGLGLSVSYGIIKSHGGEIDVKSELGKGTTFTLTIPIEMRQLDDNKNSRC